VVLTEGSSVHVEVEGHGHAERLLNGAAHVGVLPPVFWRVGDEPVGRRIRIVIHRPEGADADRFEGTVFEKVDDRTQRLFRRGRFDARAFAHAPGGVAGSADDLRAAGLDTAEAGIFECRSSSVDYSGKKEME